MLFQRFYRTESSLDQLLGSCLFKIIWLYQGVERFLSGCKVFFQVDLSKLLRLLSLLLLVVYGFGFETVLPLSFLLAITAHIMASSDRNTLAARTLPPFFQRNQLLLLFYVAVRFLLFCNLVVGLLIFHWATTYYLAGGLARNHL